MRMGMFRSKRLIVDGVDLSEFIGILYNAKRHPGNTSVGEFLKNPKSGSNCQLFSLGVLKFKGFPVELLYSGDRVGSKELWEDSEFSETVLVVNNDSPVDFINYFLKERKPFDIFFFCPPGTELAGSAEDLKKLHLGIFLGEKVLRRHLPVLHNPRDEHSMIWDVGEFFSKGYSLFGVKRPINATNT